MSRIDVLPRALLAAARAVRQAAPDAHVAATELGDATLSAALRSYLDARSCTPLLEAVDDAAQSLARSAKAYSDVEALLVPEALR